MYSISHEKLNGSNNILHKHDLVSFDVRNCKVRAYRRSVFDRQQQNSTCEVRVEAKHRGLQSFQLFNVIFSCSRRHVPTDDVRRTMSFVIGPYDLSVIDCKYMQLLLLSIPNLPKANFTYKIDTEEYRERCCLPASHTQR